MVILDSMSEEPEVLEADSIVVLTMGTDSGAEPEPSVRVAVLQLSGQDLEDSIVILQMDSAEATEIGEELLAAAKEVA